MTELQAFVFPETEQQVRTLTIDDEPWFVAADVCAVLTLRDTTSALKMADPDDQVRLRRSDTPQFFGGIAPQVQEIALVNESGIYALIFQSNKPEARAFKRWITHEVLPSIRKTGSYTAAMPMTEIEAARRYVAALEREDALKAELAVAKPKAAAFDEWLNGKGCYLIDTVANIIGAPHRSLWKLLYAEGILIEKGSRRRQPYAKPKLDGWFVVRTHALEKTNGHAASTTYATPYGAEQIRLLAINRGLIQPQLLAIQGGGSA